MNFLCQFDEQSDRSIEPAWFESLIANWTHCSWFVFELGKDVLFLQGRLFDGGFMRLASSWLHTLGRMTRQFQRWRRKLARAAHPDGERDLHEFFLFGPHG
ncbi:hypothetical protein AAFG07_13950 [Bradyrhizobium sp. B097]|uniref:hypothetical protein n=1 Tax=Bradyrhizobium sp. B097 TaxID=3140244 RepID=UPI00318442BB